MSFWSYPCEACGRKIRIGLMHVRYCEECSKSPLFGSYVPVSDSRDRIATALERIATVVEAMPRAG